MKRGISFPLEIENGGLKTSEDFELIRENIISVIETRPYERVLRSDYGLSDLIFNYTNPILINSKVTAAIKRQVPELDDITVTGNFIPGTGDYSLRIQYRINNIPQPPIQFALQQ